MVQERHPLTKAFKSEILFEMQKNALRMVVTVYFIHFSKVGFSLWKLAFQNVC